MNDAWSKRARWLVAVVLASGLHAVLARPADAQAVSESNEAGPRAAQPRILILEGPSADWTRRVQGQLSDLPAELRIARGSARPQADPGAMRELARRYRATLVVWIEPALRRSESQGREATAVALWFASSERLYTRPVAGVWSELSAADQSGALELAALSVRSAVRSLLLDSAAPATPARTAAVARSPATDTAASTPATASPERAREASPDASSAAPTNARSTDARTSLSEQAPVQPAVAALPPDDAAAASAGPPLPEPLPPEPAISARRVAPIIVEDTPNPDSDDSSLPLELRWSGEVGLAWQFYGLGAVGSPALEAGLGAGSGAWALSAFGQFGLATESRVGPARFDVQRHAVFAEVRYAAWTFDAITVSPLARVGLVILRRGPVTANTQLDPLPAANHLALGAGLGLSLEYQLSAWLGVSLRGIVNWQSSSPSFAVREKTAETTLSTAGTTLSSDAPWRLQPSLDATGKFSW